MGKIGSPETLVRKYNSNLREILKDSRFLFHGFRGGCLKSRVFIDVSVSQALTAVLLKLQMTKHIKMSVVWRTVSTNHVNVGHFTV